MQWEFWRRLIYGNKWEIIACSLFFLQEWSPVTAFSLPSCPFPFPFHYILLVFILADSITIDIVIIAPASHFTIQKRMISTILTSQNSCKNRIISWIWNDCVPGKVWYKYVILIERLCLFILNWVYCVSQYHEAPWDFISTAFFSLWKIGKQVFIPRS